MLATLRLEWTEIKPVLNAASVISVDTETNAGDIRDGRGYMTGMSISVRKGDVYLVIYLPFRHVDINLDPTEQDDVRTFFNNYKGSIVFHNAKFDLVSLSTAGINWTGSFFDTMLMSHLINENFPYEKSLNNCVKHYVDSEESKKTERVFTTYIDAFGWGAVPTELMRLYAEHDAAITLALYYSIAAEFNREVPEEYWVHKQAFVRTIIKMESRGVRINITLCNEMTSVGTIVMQDITEAIGGNLGSTKFLSELLIDELQLPVFKLTPKGKPCFDKYAMEDYDAVLERMDNPTAQHITAYRGWQKAVSSNYKPYVVLLSPDGRLRPNYKLHGTKTGRCSCEKPNLQQIPRVSDKQWNGRMKAAFVPDTDFVLWEFDYAQLEFRLGTAYAKEPKLVEVFNEGRDIFTEMSLDLGMKRYDTKQFVYMTQYGAGMAKIAAMFGITLDAAMHMRNTYKETYPAFDSVTKKASNLCKTKGKIKLWSGRHRHFKDKQKDAHKAFNSVIQGGSADIVETIMVRLMSEVDNEQCRMLLQVHDSVVFEIHKSKLEESKEEILRVMTDVQPDFGVTFKVDAHEWGKG